MPAWPGAAGLPQEQAQGSGLQPAPEQTNVAEEMRVSASLTLDPASSGPVDGWQLGVGKTFWWQLLEFGLNQLLQPHWNRKASMGRLGCYPQKSISKA